MQPSGGTGTEAAQNVTCLEGLAPGISQEYQGKLPDWYCDRQGGSWASLPAGGVAYRTLGLSRLDSSIAVERRWRWEAKATLIMEEKVEGSGRFSMASPLH